jgi:hypothetical protein
LEPFFGEKQVGTPEQALSLMLTCKSKRINTRNAQLAKISKRKADCESDFQPEKMAGAMKNGWRFVRTLRPTGGK